MRGHKAHVILPITLACLMVAWSLEAVRLPVPLTAVNFSGSSDKLNCGSGTTLDDLNASTILAWVYPTSTAGGRITSKGLFGSGSRYFMVTASDLEAGVERSSYLAVKSNTAPIAANEWQFVGAVWDTNGADADQKLYRGSLTGTVTEVGGYSLQSAGSGTPTSNASADLIIGNKSNNNSAFPGRIAWVGIWNRVLTVAEIRAQQFRPFCKSSDACVGFWHLGWAGTGIQPDLSGNGNNCTVTGATVADHAPLARWP